jgi:hypothetical protein
MKVSITGSYLDPASGDAQTYIRNFEEVMKAYAKVVEQRRAENPRDQRSLDGSRSLAPW